MANQPNNTNTASCIEELIKENPDVDLKVTSQEVQVGSVYPVYGMITNVTVSQEPGTVVVELNRQMQIELKMKDDEKINLLKERMLECAIFVSKVQSIDPILLECKTVIFGKKQTAMN